MTTTQRKSTHGKQNKESKQCEAHKKAKQGTKQRKHKQDNKTRKTKFPINNSTIIRVSLDLGLKRVHES